MRTATVLSGRRRGRRAPPRRRRGRRGGRRRRTLTLSSGIAASRPRYAAAPAAYVVALASPTARGASPSSSGAAVAAFRFSCAASARFLMAHAMISAFSWSRCFFRARTSLSSELALSDSIWDSRLGARTGPWGGGGGGGSTGGGTPRGGAPTSRREAGGRLSPAHLELVQGDALEEGHDLHFRPSVLDHLDPDLGSRSGGARASSSPDEDRRRERKRGGAASGNEGGTRETSPPSAAATDVHRVAHREHAGEHTWLYVSRIAPPPYSWSSSFASSISSTSGSGRRPPRR